MLTIYLTAMLLVALVSTLFRGIPQLKPLIRTRRLNIVPLQASSLAMPFSGCAFRLFKITISVSDNSGPAVSYISIGWL